MNVKKLQALSPPCSKPQRTASAISPYEKHEISLSQTSVTTYIPLRDHLPPSLHAHTQPEWKRLAALAQGATEKLRLLLSLGSCCKRLGPGSFRKLQEPDVHPGTSPGTALSHMLRKKMLERA